MNWKSLKRCNLQVGRVKTGTLEEYDVGCKIRKVHWFKSCSSILTPVYIHGGQFVNSTFLDIFLPELINFLVLLSLAKLWLFLFILIRVGQLCSIVLHLFPHRTRTNHGFFCCSIPSVLNRYDFLTFFL